MLSARKKCFALEREHKGENKTGEVTESRKHCNATLLHCVAMLCLIGLTRLRAASCTSHHNLDACRAVPRQQYYYNAKFRIVKFFPKKL
jgi:hypothetical protein